MVNPAGVPLPASYVPSRQLLDPASIRVDTVALLLARAVQFSGLVLALVITWRRPDDGLARLTGWLLGASPRSRCCCRTGSPGYGDWSRFRCSHSCGALISAASSRRRFVLEEYERARRRGAPILGEVLGFAGTNNGGDLILPDVRGIERTIRLGLEEARVGADDIDLVSAHATATKMGDVMEAKAMGGIYGQRPWVTGLKSYMGHTMGTCGVIETILTSWMMQEGFVAPTLNLDEVDERCAMVRHVRRLVEEPVRTAAVQNFAFGGVNTCLVLRTATP